MEGAGSGMGRLQLVLITIMVSVSVVTGGGNEVAASASEVHVVGGEGGWDITSDISAWSADRLFRVGDQIWFAYSLAAGERIVEVGSREELEACDLTNPIRMFSDGLDSITLDGEGTRFFASAIPDSCKKGLKLNIDVLPQQPTHNPLTTTTIDVDAIAAGPTTPSAAVPLRVAPSSLPCLALFFFFFLAFF